LEDFMHRHCRGFSKHGLIGLIAMTVLGTGAWAQQLETHEDHEGRMATRLGESQVVRWRVNADHDGCVDPQGAPIVSRGAVQIEVHAPGEAGGSSGVALDPGPCGCTIEVDGVYRHRGAAVAVLSSTDSHVTNQGMDIVNRCYFAVRLHPFPEILFQRHLSGDASSAGWSIPSRPVGYRFVPMNDLLLVVMEGGDGALPWPAGAQPASQSSEIATTMPLRAGDVAKMPEEVRSRLAPVAMIGHSTWAVLQEPFTYPPRRMVLGERALGQESFSAELSYDGPRLKLETIRGVDDDDEDPLPAIGFPLADFRWRQRDFGPQVHEGELELLASGSAGRIFGIRWPCRTDPHAWEPLDDYDLPTDEEWLVIVGANHRGELNVQTHLVKTCLAFQVSPFFYGRGGLFRSFENGTVQKIIEAGRPVGIEIRHSRPRILSASGGTNPLPDHRQTFEEFWPHDDWWRPFFDGDEDDGVVVVRVDGADEPVNRTASPSRTHPTVPGPVR
jgi:hypothetical protein